MPLQACTILSSVAPAKGSQPSVTRRVSSWTYGALACIMSAQVTKLWILLPRSKAAGRGSWVTHEIWSAWYTHATK